MNHSFLLKVLKFSLILLREEKFTPLTRRSLQWPTSTRSLASSVSTLSRPKFFPLPGSDQTSVTPSTTSGAKSTLSRISKLGRTTSRENAPGPERMRTSPIRGLPSTNSRKKHRLISCYSGETYKRSNSGIQKTGQMEEISLLCKDNEKRIHSYRTHDCSKWNNSAY